MQNKYDRLEKKYLKSFLDYFKKNNYKCALKVDEIQDLISFLTTAYADNVVDLIENEDDARLYFNRVKNSIPPYPLAFLFGFYRARKARVVMANVNNNEQKYVDFSYYPILRKSKKLSENDILFVGFDETNGNILKLPRELSFVTSTTLEGLYKELKDSNDYDISIVGAQLDLNEIDLAIRDIALECVARRLMGANSIDLDTKLKRANAFAKSMVAMLPNYENGIRLTDMILDLYQGIKENRLSNGENSLQKKKDN